MDRDDTRANQSKIRYYNNMDVDEVDDGGVDDDDVDRCPILQDPISSAVNPLGEFPLQIPSGG